MTSSGTYNFGLANGGAIIAAYERCQIPAPQLRNEHWVTASRELNLLFAEAANKQVNLWKVDLISVPMVAGVSSYDLPQNTILVLDAFIRTTVSGINTDRYLTPMSRTEWASQSNKQTSGAPTQYWLDRQIIPKMNMYPVADQSNVWTLYMYRCIQMMDANLPNGETPDLPYRWLDWMVAGLAYRVARVYKPALEAQRKIDAKEAWDTAAAQDIEPVNLKIAPPIGGYFR